MKTPGVAAEAGKLPQAVVARMAPEEAIALLPVAIANEPLPVTFLTEFGRVPGPGRGAHPGRHPPPDPRGAGRAARRRSARRSSSRPAASEMDAHRQLASFYGRSHRPASVRERFLHLVAGESWRAASDLLAQSGRVILSLGYSAALREALVHMTLGMPPGAGRMRALRVEAELLRYHSEFTEAVQVLRRAISDAADDERLVGECLLEISELYVKLRQLDDARRVLSRRPGCSAPHEPAAGPDPVRRGPPGRGRGAHPGPVDVQRGVPGRQAGPPPRARPR